MSKHTPGPWIVRPDPASGRGHFEITDAREYCFSVCAGGPRYYASRPPTPAVYAEYTVERLQANAQLIAVSPEMLDLLNEINHYWAFGGVEGEQQHLHVKVQALIKKARGA